ncbi:MAG: DUF6585 family protein [Anaerolineae bacterium]
MIGDPKGAPLSAPEGASTSVAAHRLYGEPIGTYPADRLRPLIASYAVVISGGLLVSATVGSLPYDWSPIVAMLIMAAITVFLAWWVLHRWNNEILLYERGFTYHEGSRFVDFSYDEIDSLRLRAEKIAYFGGLYRRNVYRITVTTIRGEQFAITNFYHRTAALGANLQERVFRALRPLMAQRLANGDAVRFGDTLRLSERGLHESGRDLGWDQFGGYRVGGRKLALLDRGGAVWFVQPLWEYDNLPLLIDLLKAHGPTVQSIPIEAQTRVETH